MNKDWIHATSFNFFIRMKYKLPFLLIATSVLVFSISNAQSKSAKPYAKILSKGKASDPDGDKLIYKSALRGSGSIYW